MADAAPNAELVAMAWLNRAGFPADSLATTLPARERWTYSHFLQVRALNGGLPDVDIPQRRRAVLALDAWAATLNGTRPLWRDAVDVMERVRVATFSSGDARPLPILLPGYTTARVLGAYLASEPARVEGDPSGYARVTCNLAVDWTA